MSSSRRPVVRVLAVAAWSLLAAIAGLIAIFQNTPMLNQSMLASSVDLEPTKMKPWGGLAYSHPSIWFGLGDNERSIRSGIVLSENGVELPQSKSLHADIRDRGAGAWSHWNRVILFSTSDGSDPRTNGRRYTVVGLTLPIRIGSILLALAAGFLAIRGVLRMLRAPRPQRERPTAPIAAVADARDASSPGPDAAPVARGRRWLLALASAGVSVLAISLLIVGLELVLRWTAPAPVPTTLELAEGLGWTRYGGPHRPIPEPRSPSPDSFLVLFVGDSFSHARQWGDLTIEALRARGIDAIGEECGVSGYGTVQELMVLRRFLPELRPHAVVLQVYLWNDPRDNWPFPGICYNARMTQRPYMDEDGVVHEPSSWLISLRRCEVWKRLLEPLLDPMRVSAGRDRLAADGIDAIAERRERLVIDYSTLDSWAPLYQPSRQDGAYMRGAWESTERALRAIRDLCAAHGVALAVLAVDQAFTVEPAAAEASVPEALRTGGDWDTELPMRRLHAITTRLEIPLFDPMPALRSQHRETGTTLHDGPGMGAHLLPRSEATLSDAVVPWLERIARDRADQRLR